MKYLLRPKSHSLSCFIPLYQIRDQIICDMSFLNWTDISLYRSRFQRATVMAGKTRLA